MLLASSNFLTPNFTAVVELVIFLVVLGIVAKFILPPVQRAMDERQSRIEQAINASSEAHSKAESLARERHEVLEQARSEARAVIDEATRAAEAEREAARARGETEREHLLATADAVIAEERQRVRHDILDRLPTIIAHAAERVLGEPVEASAHLELIESVIARELAGEREGVS